MIFFLDQGPFFLDFKRKEKRSDEPLTAFLRVDGEHFELTRPKLLFVKKSENFLNGKIKVLKLPSKNRKMKNGKLVKIEEESELINNIQQKPRGDYALPLSDME